MIIYDNNNADTATFLAKMNELLPQELMLDKSVGEWWKCVFTKCDGQIVYDSYYDRYRIAESMKQTFGTLLVRMEELLKSCPSTELMISGVWANCLPLRYVYDKVKDSTPLNITWLEGSVWHLSEGDVVMEEGDEPLTVCVPMIPETLCQMATDRKTWAEVIGDTKEDYIVGGIPMKRLEVTC